ncbi:MAG: stress responsive protein [Cyclobacteriaceae bacterium]|nr:MAG: stress responsive protein [Cyclobacteriaceae bacterium]
MESPAVQSESPLLRHVVLFKFKDDADPAAIARAEEAFVALPNKIPEIQDFEWGMNNSPEGLNKGFTHCYLLTFSSEEDRATYLPHPDHKAFGALLSDILEDVTVIDYWTN